MPCAGLVMIMTMAKGMKTATKTKWILGGCKKCGGDMHLEYEFYKDEYKCLQCGYYEPNKQRGDVMRIGHPPGRRGKWQKK